MFKYTAGTITFYLLLVICVIQTAIIFFRVSQLAVVIFIYKEKLNNILWKWNRLNIGDTVMDNDNDLG